MSKRTTSFGLLLLLQLYMLQLLLVPCHANVEIRDVAPTPSASNSSSASAPSRTHSAPHSTSSIPAHDVRQPYNATLVNGTAAHNVKYQLNCKVDDPFCSKVEQDISIALYEFAQAVHINTTIIIRIDYYSFCNEICANDTLGWCTPSSEFILPKQDGVDLNHAYPQALARQLIAPLIPVEKWLPTDVTMELNHDFYMNAVDYDGALMAGWNGTGVPPGGGFWFWNDTSFGNYSLSIQPNQIDFRYVVLHQLMHGLGFISSWAGYFSSDNSPFRQLVSGLVPDQELNIVTPGMNWQVPFDGGPTYVTSFQQTLLFDKFLFAVNCSGDSVLCRTNMSRAAFDMQGFCVDESQAFISDFLDAFSNSTQAKQAHHIYDTLLNPDSLVFVLPRPTINSSLYLTDPYLSTYTNMTLATNKLLNTQLELLDDSTGQPAAAISHLDPNTYNGTVDFLMAQGFQSGITLDDLVNSAYGTLPYNITYNDTLTNTTKQYRSPIGPGILRMLDSMGYSTALTPTFYQVNGTPPTPKLHSPCDDANNDNILTSSSSNNAPPPSTSAATSWVWTRDAPFMIALLAILHIAVYFVS
ncbi:hypothetical protein BC940DRAFT_303770 [Gongronella butleri]|nr:hypothetical protein BC940DRAFT_303770 [Gongronella butleri]